MCAWRPWPYASKAIVQHEWVVNKLNVWVTFKFTMDQTVKPANDLWLCKVDDVLKAVTVSAWVDEWTILLTVPDVLALPGRVTLEYDGPDPDLRITWEKQWEPWGAILSVRVPYLWEDILVVDTVNKRVGISVPEPLSKLDVNGNIHLRQAADSDGFKIFGFDDQVGSDVHFFIDSAGTAYFRSKGSFNLESLHNAISFRTAQDKDIWFRLGDNAGVEKMIIRDLAGTVVATIDSNGNAVFDGRISSATMTIAASSDVTDVSGVNTLFVDTTSGDVVLGGLVGGVNGQKVSIVKIVAVNDLTLEHEEGIGGDTDDFFMHQLQDETIDAGGVEVVYNGTTGKWYDTSHAKHV